MNTSAIKKLQTNRMPTGSTGYVCCIMIALRKCDSQTNLILPVQKSLTPRLPSATIPFLVAPVLRRPHGKSTDDATRLYQIALL